METTNKRDVFTVSKLILHMINDEYALYVELQHNYETLTTDRVSASRCYHYRMVCAELRDHIDAYVLKYDNVSVTDCLESNSFIWHMQWHIGKMIDSIMSNGYHYVMRDSAKLRDSYKMYERIYNQITEFCRIWHVYC